MNILAIETSCDETSVAVTGEGRLLGQGLASQIAIHEEYGGVVPELATREHLRNLLPIARAALDQAGLEPCAIDAVAATRGPGLPNALIVGYKAGQALAFASKCNFLGVHHHEAHLYSPWAQGDPLHTEWEHFEPSVSLIVSGGHTLVVHVHEELRHRVLGSTVDDAAGECFDKIAKLIGLGYPGGPQLSRLGKGGDPSAYTFPRPMLKEDHFDFSFSGLKTSVRYFLEKRPEIVSRSRSLQDLCASVEAAIVEVLVEKTIRAAVSQQVTVVTASGGVVANEALRAQLDQRCREHGLKLKLAAPELCTDNAAMIGFLAERKYLHGCNATALESEVIPNWQLDEAVD